MTTHLYPILYLSFSEFQWAKGGESHVTCSSVELTGIASRLRGGDAGAEGKKDNEEIIQRLSLLTTIHTLSRPHFSAAKPRKSMGKL